MVMDGQTQRPTGWQARVEWAMLGQKIPLSGTILTVMAEAIIQWALPQMFVQTLLELPSGLLPVETDGVARTLTVMDGQTLGTLLFTNRPNGETVMVTHLETELTAIKEMLAPKPEEHRFLTGSGAGIPMETDGRTRVIHGLLIHSGQEMHSLRNLCNGKILIKTVSETSPLGHYETTAPKNLVLLSEIYKAVLTTTVTVGPTITVDLPQPSPSWEKTLRPLG